MLVACTIAFDGTHFWGFQKTGSGKSVEDALEQSISSVLNHPIRIEAASRLDRGVHAKGQVITFNTEALPDLRRLNAKLPPSIRITDVAEVPGHFHPTLNAEKKEYRYLINHSPVQNPFSRHTAWHVPEILDIEPMKKAALSLIGTKDFKVFCNFRKDLRYGNTVRTIHSIEIEEQDDLIEIRIIGNRFMYKMVRNIVGLLVGYGRGLTLPSVEQLIESKDRSLSYVTAPAHGLSLHKIYY